MRWVNLKHRENTLRYSPLKSCILSKAMASSSIIITTYWCEMKALLGCWWTAVNVKDKQLWRTQLANCTFTECVVLARFVAKHTTAIELAHWLRGSFILQRVLMEGELYLWEKEKQSRPLAELYDWFIKLVQRAFLNQWGRRPWVFSQSEVELNLRTKTGVFWLMRTVCTFFLAFH